MTTIKSWKERLKPVQVPLRVPEHAVYQAMQSEIDELRQENARLRAANIDCVDHFDALKADYGLRTKELETERIRLAACGVVALSNTAESAVKASEMHPDYRSASLGDVERAVDAEMTLREENERLRKLLEDCQYALEYAADMTKPEGLSGCDCPICTTTLALHKELGEK